MKIDYEIVKPAIKIAKESENSLKMVCGLSLKSSVLKECFSVIYKDLEPIENLPNEEKTEIWGYICQAFKDNSKDDKIQLSKNLYIISSLF